MCILLVVAFRLSSSIPARNCSKPKVVSSFSVKQVRERVIFVVQGKNKLHAVEILLYYNYAFVLSNGVNADSI